MKTLLSSFACSGLVALGVLAGLSSATIAGPLTGPVSGISGLPSTLPVHRTGSGEWDPNCGVGRQCVVGTNRVIRRDFRRNDINEVRDWGGRRNWEGRRNWRSSDWRPRRYYRPRHYYRDPGVFLGFGLGLPAYRYIYPGYSYAQPSYRYVPRYVQPPRHNRVQMSRAHVDWCYSRYRSYRAYDNTFQPYNGPRRQCYSPYS